MKLQIFIDSEHVDKLTNDVKHIKVKREMKYGHLNSENEISERFSPSVLPRPAEQPGGVKRKEFKSLYYFTLLCNNPSTLSIVCKLMMELVAV